MEKSLTAITQESKTTHAPNFDFEKLKELAARTNPRFAETVMDADNEKPMREIWNYLFQPKGILVIGTIGSGKTYLMDFFSAALGQFQKSFRIIPAHWVIRDCTDDVKLVNDFGRYSFKKKGSGQYDFEKPITICFDDLGMEQLETKHYGNSLSILTDILFDRHNMFIKHGMKTHATSNLSIDAIAEKYADRSASRFREMFNVVAITSKDRRK